MGVRQPFTASDGLGYDQLVAASDYADAYRLLRALRMDLRWVRTSLGHLDAATAFGDAPTNAALYRGLGVLEGLRSVLRWRVQDQRDAVGRARAAVAVSAPAAAAILEGRWRHRARSLRAARHARNQQRKKA